MSENDTHTRTIFNGKVVRLEIKHIRLPDGTTAIREVIEHAGAVAIVALDENQHVYLVRQYRVGANQILYEIPAGILEPDEMPEKSAIRELREEIGHRPGSIELLGGFFTTPGYTTEYIHLYLARDLTPDALEQDTDEFLEVSRVPLAQALAMIENGTIIDSKTIIGLLRVARHLGL